MCVGACALLLLGLVLSARAGHNCVGDTYYNGHMCCHDCQPGNRMVRRCKGTMDSVCRPCNPGFYNEAVNYEDCKPCTYCNRKSGSEVKQNCTATQDTVCHCRPGTQPLDGFKHGVVSLLSTPHGVSTQPCGPHLSSCSVQAPGTIRQLRVRCLLQTARHAFLAISPWAAIRPVGHGLSLVLAAILGLGLGLGLLVPMAVLLVLYLYQKTWMPPGAPKPPGGKSFRKPIQEEQADVYSTLAKI
ncbi:PREDICTED: tumor necrosis factor receptor superfamily member 4 isoform X2 [Chinchilla lanigera]|uniref:tumor necrosis factor receptor superfamily member 4 isoform X2 n=1 Tax=Chinchilla lanigera TaxID=34839 RepID=UPI00038EB3CB|nr:PREDICTED: tumor necrosis factor receptor superfamily member 4 isoform X2 [Chinchilla lanigera]